MSGSGYCAGGIRVDYQVFPAVARALKPEQGGFNGADLCVEGGLAGAEAAAALGEGRAGTVVIVGGYPT